MSILIKNMKIPQSCYMCDMLELSGGVGCKHAYDTKNSEWGRALDCPLIELQLDEITAAHEQIGYDNGYATALSEAEALYKQLYRKIQDCYIYYCPNCGSKMEVREC